MLRCRSASVNYDNNGRVPLAGRATKKLKAVWARAWWEPNIEALTRTCTNSNAKIRWTALQARQYFHSCIPVVSHSKSAVLCLVCCWTCAARQEEMFLKSTGAAETGGRAWQMANGSTLVLVPSSVRHANVTLEGRKQGTYWIQLLQARKNRRFAATWKAMNRKLGLGSQTQCRLYSCSRWPASPSPGLFMCKEAFLFIEMTFFVKVWWTYTEGSE